VEVTGSNGNFLDGLTAFGLGSSDLQIRRMWVVGPNKIWANVAVAPNAAAATVLSSVINGFQVAAVFGFQIQPGNGRVPSLNSQLVNTAPNQTGIYPGAVVILSGSN